VRDDEKKKNKTTYFVLKSEGGGGITDEHKNKGREMTKTDSINEFNRRENPP
jgi:hypothetical protein